MPDFDTFHINENRLQEVLRVKSNLVGNILQPKIPNRVHTIQPTEKLTVIDWFNYLFKKERWAL